MILTQKIDFDIIKDGQARECIQRMLDKDPETRATVDELLLKDWVTANGKETVEVGIIDNSHKDTTRLGNMDRMKKFHSRRHESDNNISLGFISSMRVKK
jgi:serine/threonine protein kinase